MINASRIVGTIFYEGTINSERYIAQILHPFFVELGDEEKIIRILSTGWCYNTHS
ncbi:hypothetical protein C0J52_11098 [Blattella germanica]|nr:hypothetical protein C0J52_11098 [Blattella germanica]